MSSNCVPFRKRKPQIPGFLCFVYVAIKPNWINKKRRSISVITYIEQNRNRTSSKYRILAYTYNYI